MAELGSYENKNRFLANFNIFGAPPKEKKITDAEKEVL